MTQASDVSQALAALQARWGAAAPRRWGDAAPVVHGALAMALLPVEDEADEVHETGANEAEVNPAPAIVTPANPFAPATRPGVPAADLDGRVVPTGFAALDAVLGTGGLPRSATVALRGGASSGRTTLALRVAAEAQAAGSIVAWLDLARAFDPVEAVARGVRPEWLVVLVPRDLEEALALAGSLLAARTGWGDWRRWPVGRGRCSWCWHRTDWVAASPPPWTRRAGCGWNCTDRAGSAWAGTWSGSGAGPRWRATGTARPAGTRSWTSCTRTAGRGTAASHGRTCSPGWMRPPRRRGLPRPGWSGSRREHRRRPFPPRQLRRPVSRSRRPRHRLRQRPPSRPPQNHRPRPGPSP